MWASYIGRILRPYVCVLDTKAISKARLYNFVAF